MDKERVDTYKIRYRRGTLLNQGGNANVYRCEKIDTGEKFAMKILLPDISKEKQKRFANEILAMQKFGGIENGVLPILDADAENGWYVMPIATPIEEYFRDTQAGVKEKIGAVAQLAQSLEVLHLFGITHRDIKPGNLFRYKDGYCIGDFGLCEYPEGIDVDTGNNRQLGAFNTLAPEMYTDPKGQDGKKADVYSLAKTLWILLTGEPKGFTGPYSSEDSRFSFAHYPHLKDQPLAVIELLLQYATDNEPRKRMPLGEFRKVLNTWIDHADDSRYLQHFEWYLLMNHIALETQIGLRYIFDKEQIIDVLNMIKNHKILNHVMIPQGGGLDFVSAEQANEEGCIYLNLQGETILVRPKALVIATYNKSDWNFILLETEEQAPVISEHDDYEELVVEDYPAHYVSGRYAHYGVYDYDTGEKLPEGSKVLIRQLKGSFMIVPKQGGYNAINGTYDGRHDKMTVMELYQYIGEIINGKEPEIEFDPKPIKVEERHPAPLGFAKQYIEEVKVEVKPTKPLAESRISFAFYVDVQLAHSPMDFIYGIKTYLTKEGVFRKHKETDEDIYRVYSREEAIELAKSMRQQFGAYYKERGYDFGSNDCPVSITLRREGEMEPRRFTLESIKKLMREADDRVNNRLAIDEYGRPQLLQNIHLADLYPVTQGTWCADKNHVGKYSSLSDAEDSYRYMLQGWLEYITNSAQTNVVVASEDIEELEKAIEECYKEQMNLKKESENNMRILEVSRYKKEYANHQLPFVTEQGEAIRALGNDVEYFLVKGNYLKAVGALKKRIREFQPDIVHAHYGLSAITAELQSLVPVVTTFHNGETLNPVVNFASSLMSLRAEHVIYVAQHIRDLSYFKAKNYSIIPCGVPMEEMVITPKEEARKQLGWNPDKKYILFGGAFENKRKNYELLKAAVDKLRNDPSYIKHNTSDIECVEMKGLTRSQCVLRMCACDLFALPSHSEGSPQALKEAMAVNCPCLATDIADVRELFGDEPGHWILRNPRKTHERWDGDEKSLDEMVELLKEALAFEGRTKGRQRILELELSNEQVAKRIVEIYKKVI